MDQTTWKLIWNQNRIKTSLHDVMNVKRQMVIGFAWN